jgi:hypothetical protein
LLFNLFKPLLLKVMRPVIQRVLEKQIKDNVNQLDAIMYDIKKEADKAAEDAKRNPDPDNIQNIYQRYTSAANKRIMQGKQKAAKLEERAKDTHVNMAVTQQDSMFPNISLPGGISTKATEYKELASKGNKWESPVFNLGSAKETSSLPKIAAVTRKPHGRAGGYGQSGSGGAEHGQPGVGAEYGRTTGAGQGLASQMDGAFNGAATGGAAGPTSGSVAGGAGTVQ